jgi:hypothetical protein
VSRRREIELAALLERFAVLVDGVGEPAFADLYRQHAASLRAEPSPDDRRAIAEDVVATLRVSPGSLADRYLVDDAGQPDRVRSAEYVELVDAVRKRAKHLA